MTKVRLIDANALMNSMCCLDGETQCDAEDCIRYKERKYIEAAPTIEAEQVKHGKWLNTNETVWDAKEIDGEQKLEISIVSARCSVCNRWAEQVNNFPPYMKYALCPHCGAKMQTEPPEEVQ